MLQANMASFSWTYNLSAFGEQQGGQIQPMRQEMAETHHYVGNENFAQHLTPNGVWTDPAGVVSNMYGQNGLRRSTQEVYLQGAERNGHNKISIPMVIDHDRPTAGFPALRPAVPGVDIPANFTFKGYGPVIPVKIRTVPTSPTTMESEEDRMRHKSDPMDVQATGSLSQQETKEDLPTDLPTMPDLTKCPPVYLKHKPNGLVVPLHPPYYREPEGPLVPDDVAREEAQKRTTKTATMRGHPKTLHQLPFVTEA